MPAQNPLNSCPVCIVAELEADTVKIPSQNPLNSCPVGIVAVAELEVDLTKIPFKSRSILVHWELVPSESYSGSGRIRSEHGQNPHNSLLNSCPVDFALFAYVVSYYSVNIPHRFDFFGLYVTMFFTTLKSLMKVRSFCTSFFTYCFRRRKNGIQYNLAHHPYHHYWLMNITGINLHFYIHSMVILETM